MTEDDHEFPTAAPIGARGGQMASIAKRADGRWRARYRDAAGREHARHFVRKVDAQAWVDSITTAVQTGTYVDPRRSRLTVGELAGPWIAAGGT